MPAFGYYGPAAKNRAYFTLLSTDFYVAQRRTKGMWDLMSFGEAVSV